MPSRDDGHIPVYTNKPHAVDLSLRTPEQEKAHREADALRATIKRVFGVDLDAPSSTNDMSAALLTLTNTPAKAEWFSINDVPQLAFDHDMILRVAMKTLRERIHFEPVGFELLPEVFTMPQLQHLYESILGVRFDRRNFAAKMQHLDILEDTGDRPAGASSRVPVTYRFNKEKYDLLKAKGFRLEF